MKTIIILLFGSTMLACNQPTKTMETDRQATKVTDAHKEEFVNLDTHKINELLHQSTTLTAIDVMNLHYPTTLEYSEGNESIDITEEVLNNGHILITLIHDNLLDDALKGEKHIMELKKVEGQWNVISIKKNWKCRVGRGHTDWGIEYCL